MAKCDFKKNAFQHGCSPGNLLDIFRTRFLKNTSGWLLLVFLPSKISLSISGDISLATLYNSIASAYLSLLCIETELSLFKSSSQFESLLL